MIINVKDILNEIDRSWEEPVEAINEIFSEEPHNTTRLCAPFKVKLHLKKIGEDIDISGSFNVKVSYECDRCCDNASMNLSDNFHLVLLPKKEESGEAGSDETEEEVELSYYEGEEINLSDYIKEMLFLAIPIKLLCKEDCKGICPNCGVNLNKEICSCSKGDSKGSSFGILKNKNRRS